MASDIDLLDRFVAACNLDAFLAAVAALDDEPDEPLRVSQRADAHEILGTCTPATPRAVVAWAAGVLTNGHALHVKRPITAKNLSVEYSGGSLANGRWYLAKRSGLAVAENPHCDVDVIAKVTWQHVADLFGPDTIPATLLAEIDQAMAERRRRTIEWVPGAATRTTPEQEDAWAEIELCCYELGAQVWELVRPAGAR